mgnify:CR=1 FL=1
MKAIGIFRGFPGLGRVVAGVEILNHLKKSIGLEVKAISYLQGIEFGKYNKISVETINHINDVSSIGIIPVSVSGEMIIDEIDKFNPNFIIIDGEPLMLTTIKLRFPKLKVIALLNPYDLENPHNKLSSQLFFKDCYSKADIAIVHGLWKIKKPANFVNSFYSVNTFVRFQINDIKITNTSNRIVCILGGGTVNTNQLFFENTIAIAEKTLLLAHNNPNYVFEIFCGCSVVYKSIFQKAKQNNNVKIFKEVSPPEIIYNSAKAVISRAGRNTISELLVLKIPAFLFATNCGIRGSEQSANIASAQNFSNKIVCFNVKDEQLNINNAFSNLLSINGKGTNWSSGNEDILNILRNEVLCI